MAKLSVLLLDDTPEAATSFSALLAEGGLPSTVVGNVNDIFARLSDSKVDILCIHSDSCGDLLSGFRQITNQNPDLPVVVLSCNPSVNEAVAVTRCGVWEYLDTPEAAFQAVKMIGGSIEAKAVSPGQTNSKASRQGSSDHNGRGAGRTGGLNSIIGASQVMEKVFDLIEKVADTDSTILVQGESGTGKELIAKALHFEGERHAGPFVPVNCGAIPGELLESELFGHEKGAFTNAVRTRVGRFELAHGGTVFLDEIAEMSPMLQVKLLRVLQERQFERVGGAKTIESDFRVIAATNRNLEEEVKQGRFREDLYYRLNVIQIEAPPLRNRIHDIPLLAEFFIDRYNNARRRTITGFSSEALQALQAYGWPGNVRELENVVERLVILAADDQVSRNDLPERFLSPSSSTPAQVELAEDGIHLNQVVTEFEKGIIEQALGKTDWVKNRAAKLLHINRTTLIEKMKRYNMVKPT